MTEAITIITTVVYSDPGEADDSQVLLRSTFEAAEAAAHGVRRRIVEKIPLNKVCSLVVAVKN